MLPIILNLLLGIFKYICGNLSDMASITADAANNLTDAVTSLITILGVKAASTLGGKRHENGHGRIEWIVGIVVSCSIILVGWETFRNSLKAIKNPIESRFNFFIVLVMIVAIVVKLILYHFNKNKSKEKKSSAYKAAAADCISDAVSTVFVTISFILNSLWHIHVDGWCGILISFFIIRNGLQSFAEISRRVLGELVDDSMAESLCSYVLTYDDTMISEVVDFQLLDYGYERYGAFFTVRMKQNADKVRFLLLIADLKSDIYKKFGYIATIQAECPANLLEQNEIEKIIYQKVKEVDERLTIAEGTRINEGAAKPQVVLYIAIPFNYSKREHELYQKLQDKLKNEQFSFTIKLMVDSLSKPK